MAKQVIGVGTVANDNTGDFLRPAMIKVNENFSELYNFNDTLHAVAFSGDYQDLINTPPGEAFDGTYESLTGKPNLGSASEEDVEFFAVTARGLPVGGTTGQILAKNSDTNYDVEWVEDAGGIDDGSDVFDAVNAESAADRYAFFNSLAEDLLDATTSPTDGLVAVDTGAFIKTTLSTLIDDMDTTARQALLANLLADLLDGGEVVKFSDAEDGIEGLELIEEVLGQPSDVAAGTSLTLGMTIASDQFWRIRQTVSPASPLTIHLPGTDATPDDTNHTLNVRVTGITSAVPWQIEEIAAGLEDVEGRITFVNNEGNTNNCFPQNHVGTGATVEYIDGIEEADLVVPTGAGSRLTVFYRIEQTGATGVFEIIGYTKYTA